MKCKKCKRGKLKIDKCSYSDTTRFIYKCDNCQYYVSTILKYETDIFMTSIISKDVYDEMVDIISKEMFENT